MKFALRLIRHDLNSTFRDPLFKGLLFFPFICFALVRWVFPWLIAKYPVIEPYQDVLVMWACLQAATMFCFIYGFLFLEEKEENLLPVLRTLPVSTGTLVTIRQTVAISIATLINFFILEWGGILESHPIDHFLIALQMSLIAPVITLYLAVFAHTRMEGLAQIKIINILLIAPGLIYFLSQKGLHALAVVPSYWSFRAIEVSETDRLNYFLWIGFVVYLLVLIILNKRFKNKVFA